MAAEDDNRTRSMAIEARPDRIGLLLPEIKVIDNGISAPFTNAHDQDLRSF